MTEIILTAIILTPAFALAFITHNAEQRAEGRRRFIQSLRNLPPSQAEKAFLSLYLNNK
jgi:hypothetical protein